MGFLDTYSGTLKVDIDAKYHINIKKYLTNEDYTKAQEALVLDQRMDAQGIQAKLDTATYTKVLVSLAIVDWNLDDADGNPLPVNDATISKLPQVVFTKVYEAIESQGEGRNPAEQVEFLQPR